jgi:hypothetical protein
MGDNRALNIVFRAMATLAAHGVLLGWRSPRVALGSVNCYCDIACYLHNSHGRRGRIPVGGRFLMGMSGASFAALAYQALRFVSRN